MTGLKIVLLGLSITSSWGNGHATTYRGLVRQLARRGHDVLFLERDMPWYAAHRDIPDLPGVCTDLYTSLPDLQDRYETAIREADLVIVGSYVPEGVKVGQWVTGTRKGIAAFYDIDTPVTLAKLEKGDREYLSPDLIPQFDLYLSFTGGPTLNRLERRYGAPRARPLYCSFDPNLYFSENIEPQWDLGYLGTYSEDRQPALDSLLLGPARRWKAGRFIVAGPLYPESILWPDNVRRVDHVGPDAHRVFYNGQRFTLNVTRADMVRAGYSPSVRLFEAAACGVPIISDYWDGLDSFFKFGEEILVCRSAAEVLEVLREMPETERAEIGRRARDRVLCGHTAAHRSEQLEAYVAEVRNA